MADVIKGFKGFDKDMKCKGFQYEVGKEYKCDKAKACETGFHFCENPIDVFSYYAPNDSVFAEVEGSGKTDKHVDDSKIACTHIKIGSKIIISAIIEAAIKFTFSRAKWSNGNTVNKKSGAASATGERGAASATGWSGAASATGERGAASATGEIGAASATGEQSIACGLGYRCMARGALGCWLVLAERESYIKSFTIKSVKTAKVDGKKIKADTWYTMTDGKFVEVKE